MTYLETLLKSATAEAKSMLNENIRLNDQIKSLQVTLDRTTIKLNHIAMIADDLKSRLTQSLSCPPHVTTYGGYTFEQFKAILDSNKLMTERLQWLHNESNNNKLSEWQLLVVREALDLDSTLQQGAPTPPAMFTAPEKWIVEHINNYSKEWERSFDAGVCDEFPSEAAAANAIAEDAKYHTDDIIRRARRIA